MADKSTHEFRSRRLALWLGLLIVVACAAYATATRLSQLSAWESSPALYVASGVPMMSTLDAYYSLRLARLQAAGSFVPHGPVPARHYSRPQQDSSGEWYDQREPQFLPLLSRMIAAASFATVGDIDRAGLILSPWLSSLFMVPLFLCCWRLGAPAAGLMGGLVATFCIEYYRRTSVGWVDTDALNLFFPWTISFLILMMSAELRRDRVLLLAAAAGSVSYVFYLWYPHQGITALYAAAMAMHLILTGVSWRRCLLCVAVLVVFANPVQMGGALANIEAFAERYLSAAPAQQVDVSSALRFPGVWSTISEVKSLHWAETLRLVLQRFDFTVIGLVAFVPFGLRYWRGMAALAPTLLLGALALASSRRFIPYLAPFVGIGWGFIIGMLVRGVLGRIGVEHGAAVEAPRQPMMLRLGTMMQALVVKPVAQTTIAYLCVVAVFFVWFAPVSGKGHQPQPAVPAPVFSDLQTLAQRLPANSRIWTWWDLGFAIVDTTGFGVYHDGAAQYTAQTNLIAASFVHSAPRTMHDLIGFVDREGNRGILRLAARAADFDDLMSRMKREKQGGNEVPIYVLYTPDMLLKYSSMRYLGTPIGTAVPDPGGIGIRWLDCERIVDDRLHCGTRSADLRTGALEGSWSYGEAIPTAPARLRRAVVVEGGRVIRERDYGDGDGLTAQIVFEDGNLRAVYVLDEPAYWSNLNQMFVLGRFDANYFEEVFNDFPYARVFRVIAHGNHRLKP